MSLFRSEDMEYCRLVVPRESAWETLNELGKIDCLHQVDSDSQVPNISRPFYSQIKRCDEVEFMLHEIHKKIIQFEGTINKCTDIQELVGIIFPRVIRSRQRAGRTYFDEIEGEIKQRHLNLTYQIQNLDGILEKQKHLEEYKHVLIKSSEIMGHTFFSSGPEDSQFDSDHKRSGSLDELKTDSSSNLYKIFGIIETADATRFQKVIFRITKGNCWIAFRDVPELSINTNSRSAFALVFPGHRNGVIHTKVQRICESFNANRYQLPQTLEGHRLKILEIQQQSNELKSIIALTEKGIQDSLLEFTKAKHNSGFSYIEYIRHYVAKEKQIFIALNQLKISGSVFVGFCWLPKHKLPIVEEALSQLGSSFANLPSSTIKVIEQHDMSPPTYFKLNEFKSIFQLIVDTYGVPRYKEVNPGLFTIITFPFLFGVMFGDIGHGGLLFILGLYLLFFKDSILADKTSSFKPLVSARYLISLMGFFALYAGFIYNDFLSININFFGSCYAFVGNEQTAYPQKDCVYPFGLDPIWGKAQNQLTNANSFKMKLAVIFAVLQMCMGIFMKAFNSVYFRKWLDFFFEFIPQILFMGLMFGYMDYLIFAKWATNFRTEDHGYTDKIPAIITTLIDMALKMGGISDTNGSLVENQTSIQGFILAVALICVPMMLIPKPLILNYQNKKKLNESQLLNGDSSQRLLVGNGDEEDLARDLEQAQNGNIRQSENQIKGNHSSHDDFGEIFVHQIIETIEFVLGSISNTASYLRLWALSLAHSQLADVFFSKGIQSGLESGSVPMLVIGYFVFALVTMGVLLAMDVMECFLHALRLHWVEFQNKFYKADGYAFTPLSFVKSIIDSIPSEDDEEVSYVKKSN